MRKQKGMREMRALGVAGEVPAQHVDALFKRMRARIQTTNDPRLARSLLRDLIVYSLIQNTGLRVSEVSALNLMDWGRDDAHDVLLVFDRKGRFSRTVSIEDPAVATLVTMYVRVARPHFVKAPGHELALFLSSRGRRLSIAALNVQFQRHLHAAGLEEHEYALHHLRVGAVQKFVHHRVSHLAESSTWAYVQVPTRTMAKVVSAKLRLDATALPDGTE